jgi:hypothetical protein
MNLQTAMLMAQRDALYELLYQVIDGGNWSIGGTSMNPAGFMCVPYGEAERVMEELAEVKRKIKGIEDGE